MLFVVAEICTGDKRTLKEKQRIIWAPGFEGAVRGQLARVMRSVARQDEIEE